MNELYCNKVGELDLSDAPFELILLDTDRMVVFDKSLSDYMILMPSEFAGRYNGYLKRKLHIDNAPVRIVTVKKGLIFFIDRGLGGFSKEELIFAPWERFHHKDSLPVIEKALSLVDETGSAIMVTDWETKSGRYSFPIKTLMIQASGDMAVFSVVAEECVQDLERWIRQGSANDENPE